MKSLRNEEIARQVEAGDLTLEAIGKPYGLSRERVRQIARKERVTPKSLQRQIQQVLPWEIEVVIRNPWGLPKVCSHGSCLEPEHCRGLCKRHYNTWAYHYLPGRREYMNQRSRERWSKNPESVREVNKRARERYRLRQKGLLPPVKREPVPKALQSSRGNP